MARLDFPQLVKELCSVVDCLYHYVTNTLDSPPQIGVRPPSKETEPSGFFLTSEITKLLG